MNTPLEALAFSLVELLVAMAVFAILGLLTISIISATDRSTNLSIRDIDSASQARLALDRIGMDLRGLVKRDDLAFAAQNIPVGTADALMVFASLVASAGIPASDNRNISIVAYQVGPHSDNADRLCLLRGAKPIKWADTGFFGLQSNGLPPVSIPAAFSPVYPGDYDVLASGIIRMVVGFQLYPDNQPVILADGSSVPLAQGQIVYSPPLQTRPASANGLTVKNVDLSRISAIVVGIVVLDMNTLRLANADQTKSLASAFPVPVSNKLPVQAWSAIANDVTATPAAVPVQVRQALRVFERLYPVTPFGTKENG